MNDLTSDKSSGKTSKEDHRSGSIDDSTRSLTLSAYYENLDQVRDFAADAAKHCGFESDDIYNIQLAVDEAFTNIVEHAYGGEGDEEILCKCYVTQDELTITFKDCGQPFEPENVPDPDLESDLYERQVGGLGLFFIRELMDEVEYTFTVEGGTGKRCNIIKMVKHRPNGV